MSNVTLKEFDQEEWWDYVRLLCPGMTREDLHRGVGAVSGREAKDGAAMSSLLIPKEPRLELPKLTALAENQPCFLRVPDVCNGGGPTTVWAHSNMSRHGRGSHRKSDDCFGCFACMPCHYWLDFGPAPRADKEEAFVRAMERTMRYLWMTGKVRVT